MTKAWSIMGAAAIGTLIAVLLVPGGSPRPLMFQLMLASGLVLGLLAAQRVRPSPTEWALGVGALSLVVSWQR
jgi:hypothetical protein